MLFDHLDEALADKATLTRPELEAFRIGNETRKLIDRTKGIWNPSDLEATLSIMSTSDGPYSDEQVSDSVFAYAYRKDNPEGDNTKLRRAFELKLPIVWLRKIRKGVYFPAYPVYVIDDDRRNQRFLVSLVKPLETPETPENAPLQREYANRITKQRLHQAEFRGRVLLAYDHRCAVCGLTLGKLLDAAHIVADGKPNGTPTVDNGLSLCKIHHAAYDADYLGISPDSEIRIQPKIMKISGDEMLLHTLQKLDRTSLSRPSRTKDRPSPERLAERFDEFTENNRPISERYKETHQPANS